MGEAVNEKETDCYFSIVVPIYNIEAYLRSCIDSVLSQSFNSFELILVNDGSTDSSPVICEEYKRQDCRVKVIHKHNAGLVSARKAGAVIARGYYTLCLDGDDSVTPNYLSEIYAVCELNDPDIVCFDFYETVGVDCTYRKLPYKEGLYSEDRIRKEIYPSLIQSEDGRYFPPAIWAKAFKTALYKPEQLAVDDGIKIGEDAACVIPCMLKAKTISVLGKALYYYKRRDTSMTKEGRPFSWEGPELIEAHLTSRMNDGEGLSDQVHRRTIKSLINVVKSQFYRKESYRTIVEDIDQHLSAPCYAQAIRAGKFKPLSFVGIFAFFLKTGIYFPFYILSKVRR